MIMLAWCGFAHAQQLSFGTLTSSFSLNGTTTYGYKRPGGTIVSQGQSSYASACSAAAGYFNANPGACAFTFNSTFTAPSQCVVTQVGSNGGAGCTWGSETQVAFTSGGVTCPANSTQTGTTSSGVTCQCSSGYGYNGTSCVAASVPAIGTGVVPFVEGRKYTCNTTTGQACVTNNGFGLLVQFDSSAGSGVDGYCFGQAVSMGTGVGCNPVTSSTPSAQLVTDAALNACQQGQIAGVVNGQNVCIDATISERNLIVSQSGTTYSGTNITTTQTTDGRITETTQQLSGGGGGTATSNPAGASTTSTTTATKVGADSLIQTAPSSSSGNVNVDVQVSFADYCAQNANSRLCQAGGTFSGSCGAFTCTGDATECAVAREIHTRNCQLVDGNGQSTTYSAQFNQAAAAGNPGPAGTSVSMSMQSVIDQTNLLGSSCPTDVTIGSGLVLPLSELCSPLQLLGQLLVGLTMFAALFIVFRS